MYTARMTKTMERIAVYVHYEPNGNVPEYAAYCISELSKECERVIVVVNGKLTAAGRKKLACLGVEALVRENKGFDFWAYKAGIELIGDDLARYDELLLTNNSYYGPVFPFKDMFGEMDKRECDFWGINRDPRGYRLLSPENKVDAWAYPHIQSFWLAIRRRMFSSAEFKRYWSKLPKMDRLMDAITLGETRFTDHFESRGFKSEAFIDVDKYEFLIRHNFSFLNDQEVIEDRCPVVKRKYFSAFKHEAEYQIPFRAQKLLDFIKDQNPKLYGLIWDDLLDSVPNSELSDSLGFNRILPSDVAKPRKTRPKTALLVYIYYAEKLDYMFSFVSKLPKWIDLIIVSPNKDVLELAKPKFADLCNSKLYVEHKNRGREQSAFLITCRKEIAKYEYVGIIHAKRSESSYKIMPGLLGVYAEDFNNHCLQSLVASGDYVDNIIAEFERDERLGMLVPFTFNHAQSFSVGNEWHSTVCFEASRRFLKDLFGVKRPLDPHVMAPYGGMFWARTKALATLFSHKWRLEDFPAEPFRPDDNSALPYCLERLFPILAQDDGFYTAFVAPDIYARSYVSDLYVFARGVKEPLYKRWGFLSDQQLLEALSTADPNGLKFEANAVADALKIERLRWLHIWQKAIWKYLSSKKKRQSRRAKDMKLKARILNAKRVIWATRKVGLKKSTS